MLNAHMARLPRFRGMNVLEWSVWAGEPPAVTIHFVTSGIDLGDILAVREIPVTRDDTISTLRARSYAVMVEAMAESVAALHEGRETRTPQQPSEGRQYFAMHPELLRIAEQRLARRKTAARS
jgi:methionyl-tRNA formyltransferase